MGFAAQGCNHFATLELKRRMLDEQQFKTYCDSTLETLNRSLGRAGDELGFEADMNNGALTVEFEDPPARFVISPQTPVRQIWVSAHSRSFKLEWNETARAFVLPATGQNLSELMAEQISKQLGEEVKL